MTYAAELLLAAAGRNEKYPTTDARTQLSRALTAEGCCNAPDRNRSWTFSLKASGEGAQARTNGDATEANPYPVGASERGIRPEGWRMYDVLRENPPADAALFERFAWGDPA
jgi:hypothetical protein